MDSANVFTSLLPLNSDHVWLQLHNLSPAADCPRVFKNRTIVTSFTTFNIVSAIIAIHRFD